MKMQGIASSGPLGRRLSAVQTVETKVDVQQEAAENSEASEDVIMLDKNGSYLNEAFQGPLEYADTFLRGVANEEARTTRTTKSIKGKKTKVPLDSIQWLTLIATGVLTLAAVGWWALEGLPKFAKPKPEPMVIPQYDPVDPKWQLADLQMAVTRLKSNWEDASEDVKKEFIKKHFNIYLKGSEMPRNLRVLLDSAEDLLDLGTPEEEEKEENIKTFSKNVTLVTGALQAATHRLSALVRIKQYEEKKKKGRGKGREIKRRIKRCK